MKRAWIAFAVTLILLLPARIFAMLRYLNPITGFYSDGGKLVEIVSVLLAAGIAVTVILAGFGGIERKGSEPLKNTPAAAFGALAGVFVLVQSAVGLGAGLSGDMQVSYRIFSAAGILAGGVFLLSAYDFATGQRRVGQRPMVALIPSVWGCLFLVVLFITYSAVVNLVEDAYHTFTVISLLLFLFAQAKLLTGIESEKSGKMIYMTGLPAALLALLTGIPSCVQYFSAGRMAGALPVGLHMANILLAVYILAFLAAVQLEPVPTNGESASDAESCLSAVCDDTDEFPCPKEARESGDLAGCLNFLKCAYQSGEEFVCAAESPFLRDDSDSQES